MTNVSLILLIGVVVLIVAGVFLWRYYFGLPRNFGEVVPGVLYRSGQGSGVQIGRAIDQYNIKTLICLRKIRKKSEPHWFRQEKKIAERKGAKVIHYPMTPKALAEDQFWIDLLSQTQNPSTRPVLVHCAQGELRTGFFCAIYRIVIDHWSVEQAIEEMESFGYNLRGHTFAVAALRQINVEEAREKVQKHLFTEKKAQ